MITHRFWTELEYKIGYITTKKLYCEGWYLFGIIPLYIIKKEVQS